MHPLLLALALGQAAPAAPPGPSATTLDMPAATALEPALPAADPPTDAPPPEPAPAELPRPPPDGPKLRPVDLVRLPDGTFRATLDGQPVAGAAFYRAVLRPDLADRLEEAQDGRTALWISAGLAPLVGAGVGWVAGTAQHRTVGCDEPGPPITDPAVLAGCERLRQQNQATVNGATATGAAVGLAAGVLLWLAGRSIQPPEPTADEAEALVRAYRARGGPAPAPAPGRPATGASLLLETGPRAARLALRLSF